MLHRTVLLALLSLFGSAAAAPPARVPVSEEAIREAIRSAWAEIAPPGATLEIRALPRLPAAAGEVDLAVTLPEGIRSPGPRAIAVTCRQDGRVVARGLASIVVRAERDVWIAARPLRRGELLDPAALTRETRVWDREPYHLFVFAPERRWRVRRDVPAGEELRASHVRALADIESGSEILLVSQVGQARVAVAARARHAGDVGDVILVHNPLTNTLVKARILDSNTATLVTARTDPASRSDHK
jgi:flagella basal body P-ring formation protein FlgA